MDAADPRLEACYAFEDDGRDGSAYGRDLVLESTSFVAGPAGMALSRAASSRASAPSLTALAPAGLTIELWARVDRIPTTGRAGLVDKDGQFGVFVHPGGEIRCTAGAGAAVACAGIAEGAWRHVACTYDGAALRLYLDGAACDEVASSGSIPAGEADLHLGENSPDAADALEGALDSVRLWSVALPADEICASAGCRWWWWSRDRWLRR